MRRPRPHPRPYRHPRSSRPPRSPLPPVETGDIVITARRRNESLQEVPLAVSVIGDERLATTGSFNVSRLSQIQPSLQFYSTNPRNSAANIRGLGAPFGLTNDGIEQGVGVYVDQVYYSRIASTTFDFLDVERVEVLRGPQGTLYGKNTTAGAVNLISRPPSFQTEGRAELSLGNLDYVQARGSISGPLIADTLAIRVGGFGDPPPRHDLQHDHRPLGQRAREYRPARRLAVARDPAPQPHLVRRITASRTPCAAPRSTCAPARRSGRSTASSRRSPPPSATRRRAPTRSTG